MCTRLSSLLIVKSYPKKKKKIDTSGISLAFFARETIISEKISRVPSRVGGSVSQKPESCPEDSTFWGKSTVFSQGSLVFSSERGGKETGTRREGGGGGGGGRCLPERREKVVVLVHGSSTRARVHACND